MQLYIPFSPCCFSHSQDVRAGYEGCSTTREACFNEETRWTIVPSGIGTISSGTLNEHNSTM